MQSTARIGEKTGALGLRTVNKNPRGIETSSKRKSTDDVRAFKHKSSQSLPCNDVRYDGLHHYPEYRSSKLNFRLFKVGNSRVYCKKCNIAYA